MGKFYESKFFRVLQIAYELIKLNIVAVFCSVPIVTVGAVWTGVYASVDGIYNGEGSTIKDFFAAFKKNFKRATLHWLLLLVFFAFAVGYVIILNLYTAEEISKAMVIIPLVITLIATLASGLLFPLLNVFKAPFFQTIRISLVFSIKYFLRAFFVFLLNVAPFALLYIKTSLFLSLLPVWLFIAFAVIAYVNYWAILPAVDEINRLLEENEEEGEC